MLKGTALVGEPQMAAHPVVTEQRGGKDVIWEDFLQLKMEMKLKQEEAAIRGWVSIWKPPDPRKGPCGSRPSWAWTQDGDGSKGKVESEESKDLYPRLRIQHLRGVGEHWLRGIFRTIDLRAAT